MDDSGTEANYLTNFAMTPRQADCMELVKRGLTSKQIAHKLGISFRTVDQHVGTVIELLQVNNRMAAVMLLEKLERERAEKKQKESNSGFLFVEPEVSPDFSASLVLDRTARPSLPSKRSKPFFPPLGGTTTMTSPSSRMRWIGRIASGSIVASCAALLTIMGVVELAG